MAKFTNCLQIINAMPQQDQDALLARLDELQAQGMSPKEAQLQAAIDVLAQVEREGGIRKSASRVTDTANFKRWSGGAPVIELGDKHEFRSGQPVVVEALHGTTNADLTEFKRERANIESDMGAGFYASNTPEDVAENYANKAGPDLLSKRARLSERIADELRESDDWMDADDDAIDAEVEAQVNAVYPDSAPNTMKLYMRFKNPVVLGGKGETFFDYNEEYNEDTDEYGEPTGLLVDFVNALDEAGDGIDVSLRDIEQTKAKIFEAAEGDGLKFGDLARIVKDNLIDSYGVASGDSASSEMLRQALAAMGFDGVIDTTVSTKFKNMAGMTPDTVHFIAFEPEQIKSATGNSGEFGENRNILKSVDRPQFYSQLQRAIEGVPARLDNMGAAAWKQWLTANAPKLGVKAEEVEWSGIKDYLDLQGKKKLSKDELAAYLDESGVKISEVTLADKTDADSGFYSEESSDDNGVWIVYNRDDEVVETFDSEDDADAFVRDRNSDVAGGTKYGQYTLPGGENYREVLITLPGDPGFKTFKAENGTWGIERSDGLKLDGWPSEQAAIDSQKSFTMPGQYESSHWDEKNVLAHIRVNDRTAKEVGYVARNTRSGNSSEVFATREQAEAYQAKLPASVKTEIVEKPRDVRVLFVEEVQSDWGQEGKKKGFKGEKGAPLSDAEYKRANELQRRDRIDGEPLTQAERAELDALMARHTRAYDGLMVPAAPFVTKTEGWLNLALKRIAMLAVEEGYDKVAFVNGEQSAQRYDLSNEIEYVSYLPRGEGKAGLFEAWDKNRKQIFANQLLPEQLEEYIGKEIAERLLATKPVYGKHTLEGVGLKTGGEGMKTFYDQIVPQAVNKLLPKLGGEKLGFVDIGSDTLFDGNGKEVKLKAMPQPGFDVTDKMRETVGAGVPLFSRDRTQAAEFKRWSRNAPLVMAKDALSYDFQDGKPFVAQTFHGTNSEEDFAEFDLERGGDQTAAESAGMGIFSTNEPVVAGEYAKNIGFGRYLGLAFNGATDLQQDPTASRLQKKVDDARKAVSQASYDAVTETIPYLGDLAKGRSEELQRKLATSLMEIAPGAEERMAKIQGAYDKLLVAERELSSYVTDYEASKIPQRIMPLYVRMANPKVYDANGQTPGDFPLSERIAAAKRAGHDGVVFKNIADPSPVAVHYVSFNPNDIKSATGNSGEFSESADIRKSADRTQTAEFKKWFGDSKVVDANGKPLVMYHGTRPGNDITEFDESDYDGIYFTPDSKYAESFTEGLFDDSGEKGAIYPVYLSIQNPYVVRTTWGSDEAEGFLYRELDRRKLEADGYDGAMLYIDGELDQAQVFRSNQIKSATGNNGEFSQANPDIRKSADRPWFGDLGKLKVSTNYQLGDLLKSSKKLNWWNRTVGTQYNIAQKNPEFKRVFDAVQTFINDVSAYATQAADLAPNILPKLDGIRDVFKKPLAAEDVKALRDPIFGGTLNYTRDEDGNIVTTDDVQKAGVVFTDAELRDMFGLNDKQIDLYREFRQATDRSLTDLALSDMVRYLGEDGSDIREEIMASANVDVAAGIIKSHLSAMARMTPEREKSLGDSINAIEQKAEQANNLMDRGYAPLSRFGQYTVYVVGKDGEQIYFSMFETQREANKMAREMQEQYPDAEVTAGTMSQESYKLFSGVTPETLALFGESLGLEESGIDPKSEAFQQYLKLAKTNRSAMKRLIQRKGVDGFSEDAGRVLAGFVYSNARQVSTNLHAGEISRSASEIQDGDVKDHAIRLMEYIQNPTEEAQKLKALLFTTFLGGNISSAVVNFTQTATTTFPYLSQFDSTGSVMKRLGDAVKLAARGIRNDDELKQALKRAEDEGVVSPQEVFHLMAQAQGKAQLQTGDGTRVGDALAKTNNFMTKATLAWGRLFSAAEQANRRIAFIAAYKLARDKGMANPFEFAEKTVLETQFSTNKGIRPAWARGAVGGVLFTFKGFTIAYLELLSRMLGNGPEGKKAFALALGTLFLFAGAGGLPFVDDLDDVVDGFAQRVLGKSFDSKQAKKEFFASIFGQTGAEFVMGGLTSLPGAPIDISGRLGLGNIVPGTGIAPKKASYQRDAMEIFGPAGSLFSNYAMAIGMLAQGEVKSAAAQAAPLGIQNLIKGLDMAQMGFYRDTKGRKVIDTNAWEAAAKALGFQPASVKRVQDATATQQGLIAQNKLRETEIADKMARARIERKPELAVEAREELAEWNRKNPESPIKIDQAQINRRVQQAMMDKAQRIAKTAPKEIRQSVTQELERASN